MLWLRGTPGVLTRPAVAIVGSRAATPYASGGRRRAARRRTRRHAASSWSSGLARGVDSAAHRGALGAGGATVAVLGCGPDLIYPPEHATLAARSRRRGLVVSELAPGTPPLPEHFPLRNRIISGISPARRGRRSGREERVAHHRAVALEQGRDVLAVPGQRAGRPQPRLPRASKGRRKGRRVGGRYSGELGWRLTCLQPVRTSLARGPAVSKMRKWRGLTTWKSPSTGSNLALTA